MNRCGKCTSAILIGCLLLIEGCTNMSDKNIDAVRMAIETRDFVGWNGLPDACAPGDLFDDFPDELSDRPTRPLGESFSPAVFVLLKLDGYYRPTASVLENELVLFDGMNPELPGGFQRLFDELGAPAARSDWFHGTLEIPNGEWVYPERGITVFLNSSADKALHIAVYHPTHLENYFRTLRPHLRKEERPMSHPDHE